MLIPFTAILLIQEDQMCMQDEAWEVWWQSGEWGMVNQPDQSNTGPHTIVKPEPSNENIQVLSINNGLEKWQIKHQRDGEGNKVEVLVLQDE